MQTTSRRARRLRPGGTLVLLAFPGLGKIAIFSPCKAKPILQAHARGRRLTRRSSSERWRPETAGACTKSSAAPAPPTGRSRSGTTGSASRRSSEETSPIARTAADELLYPGALLLGNNGSCFECGHAHGIGDRCISLNVCEEQFSEVAAATTSTSRFRFSAPSLPPSPKGAADRCADGGAVLRPVFAALRGVGVADHRARHCPDDRRSTDSGRCRQDARRDG